MATTDGKPLNPFSVPESTSPLMPLRPSSVPAHADYYVPVAGMPEAFDEFTSQLRDRPSDGRLVLVTGESGCGKTSLVNRCVHWLEVTSGWLVVDLRAHRLPVAPVEQRMRRVCRVLSEELHRLPDIMPLIRADDEPKVDPETFYRLVRERMSGVLVVILPSIEDLVSEAVAYAVLAGEGLFFFAESALLTDANITRIQRSPTPNAPPLVLRVRKLTGDEVRLFLTDRLTRHRGEGTYPGMSQDTMSRVGDVIQSIGQLQRLLHGTYEERLRAADRFSSQDEVTFDDITRYLLRTLQASRQADSAEAVDQGAVEVIATEVDWWSDAPAKRDRLKREAMARMLALRIHQTKDREPDTSLLIHLDGAWGSGKTTLLNMLEERLVEDGFLVVRFDAWQQSRLSPPWWALLTTTRDTILGDHGWWARRLLHVREAWERARRSGAYLFAIALLLLLTSGLSLLVWLGIGSTQTRADLLRVLAPTITAIGLLWSGSRMVSRLLLWNSARGARLFEQSDTNPMGRVAAHFDWLLRRSAKRVVFFIDDLDRCRHEYVVELLESVQTMVRDAPRTGSSAGPGPAAAYFVVAADGFWLRRSYTNVYQDFDNGDSRQHSSLGYLFMEKLFQLIVPMPALSAATQRRYLDHLLGLQAPDLAENDPRVTEARSRIQAAGEDEQSIVDTFTEIEDPAVRDAVAADAAEAIAKAPPPTEHLLRKFAPLLSPNPRVIKLFINTYSTLLEVRALEGDIPQLDTLALWAIIRVRWPSIADHLQREPEAVKGIRDPLWCSDLFPEELRDLAKTDQLREVVCYEKGGPLTPDAIRECCGTG